MQYVCTDRDFDMQTRTAVLQPRVCQIVVRLYVHCMVVVARSYYTLCLCFKTHPPPSPPPPPSRRRTCNHTHVHTHTRVSEGTQQRIAAAAAVPPRLCSSSRGTALATNSGSLAPAHDSSTPQEVASMFHRQFSSTSHRTVISPPLLLSSEVSTIDCLRIHLYIGIALSTGPPTHGRDYPVLNKYRRSRYSVQNKSSRRSTLESRVPVRYRTHEPSRVDRHGVWAVGVLRRGCRAPDPCPPSRVRRSRSVPLGTVG